MTYKPLTLPDSPKDTMLSTLPSRGGNLLQPSQFTDLGFALVINNMIIEKDFTLTKSKGLTVDIEQGTTAVTGLLKWKGITYFGQDDKLYVNDGTTTTLIHTFAGVGDVIFTKFGDYVFAANGSEKPIRITRTLAYDTQVGNFTVNQKVTDQATGANAIILEDADAGASGVLTLGSIDETLGAFTATNQITDPITGNADVTSAIAFTVTSISDAPICGGVSIYKQHLLLTKIQEDLSKQTWSGKFVGTNPPFTNFTTIATPPLTTDPGSTYFGDAGAVTIPVVNNSQLVTWYTGGNSGIRISEQNVDTFGLRQKVEEDFQDENLGAFAAVSVKDGIYFVNSGGIWFSPVRTETTQAFTITSEKAVQLFSAEFVKSLDFTDAHGVFDEINNRVLFTCKKDDSAFNNFVLILYADLKNKNGIPFTTRTGWFIKRFFVLDKEIFGSSSVEGKIYKLFDSNSDEGLNIKISLKQEVTRGDVTGLHEMQEMYAGGLLAANQTVTWSFDVYDQLGILKEDLTDGQDTAWELTGEETEISGAGVSAIPIGSGGVGGSGSASLLKESWYHRDLSIYEYSRLIVKMEESSGLPFKLIWYSLITQSKGRNNNISQ